MTDFSIDALKKAVNQFEKGIIKAEAFPDDDLMRDGAIQRFEYTMELSWKLIQRYLKDVVMISPSAIETKHDLFREAAKLNLIFDVEKWIAYYKARNSTSHDYDEEKAKAMFQTAAHFLEDAKKLVREFEKKGIC